MSSEEKVILLTNIDSLLSNSFSNFKRIDKTKIADEIKAIVDKYKQKLRLSFRNNDLGEHIPPGFYIEYILGDGTCGYHALAKELNFINNNQNPIRNGFELRNYLSGFISKDLNTNLNKIDNFNIHEPQRTTRKRLINEVSNYNEYIDDSVLSYISKKFKICILIYDARLKTWTPKFSEEIKCLKIICLILSGQHYNILKPLPGLDKDIFNIIKKSYNNSKFINFASKINSLQTSNNEFLSIRLSFKERIKFIIELSRKFKNNTYNKLLDELNKIKISEFTGGSNIPHPPPAPRRNTRIPIKDIKLQLKLFYESILINLNDKSSIEVLFKLCYFIRLLDCLSNPPHNIETLIIEFNGHMNDNTLLENLENYFSKF